MTNTQFFALIATSSVSEYMVAAFKYHLNISFPAKKQQQNNKQTKQHQKQLTVFLVNFVVLLILIPCVQFSSSLCVNA